MKIAVKKSAITDFLREILNPIIPGKDAPVSVTEPPLSEPPVNASDRATINGLFDLPPIEDLSWMPKNSAMLSKAAYALGQNVPPKQIAKFYIKLRQLIQDSEAWQQREDLNMSIDKVEETLRNKIRQLIKEANESEEDNLGLVPGMMKDYEEEGNPIEDPTPEEIAMQRAQTKSASAEKLKKPWSDINLRRKKKEVEFFDKPGYVPEVPGDEYGRHDPKGWEELAANAGIEGLNSTSSVRQFVGDERRLNLLDKFKYLINMPEKERNKIMVSAAVSFIDGVEEGKYDTIIDYKDPGVQEVVKNYINDLELEETLDPEDVAELKKNTQHVVQLDSFKPYMINYFDNNFSAMLKHEPFRDHLGKYWHKMLKDDPVLMASIEARAQKDIQRVVDKKAKKKLGTNL